MTYFYAIIAFIAAALTYMRFEAGWVKVDRIDFAKGTKGLKIIHLSDIHLKFLRVPSEKVCRIIRQENPDLIVISGDFIDKPVQASLLLKFLASIRCGYRTLLCLGNHDFYAYARNPDGMKLLIREMESSGIEVLHNRSVQLEKNLRKYNFIGIEDLRHGHPDVAKAFSGCQPDGATNIVFSHNPDIVLELPKNRADYLLCGHFHGGQIWMPFNLEFTLLRDDQLCKMGIRRGLHKVNGVQLYINRGLGNVLFPLRFFSRPEITVITFP